MSDLSHVPASHLPMHEWLEAMAVPAALHVGGHWIDANDALCRLAGRPVEDLRAMPHAALFAEAERSTWVPSCAACLADGTPPPALVTQLLTPDGSERPVELHARPVSWGAGRAVLVTVNDLSDIQHVQTSLLALSAVLRQIVDGTPIASFVIDRDHAVTHWNIACERMTARARRDMLGSCEAWRAFHDAARPLLVDLIVDGVPPAQVLEHYPLATPTASTAPGGYEAEAFFPGIGPEGCWLHFTAAPLHDAQGEVVGAIQTLQDVSGRRRTEQDLQRHHDELERLVAQRSAELAATAHELELFVAHAPFGVALTQDGLVQRANRAMAELLGREESRLAGLSLADLDFQPDAVREIVAQAKEARRHHAPLRHEMWMRRADGLPLWVQVDAHELETAEGGRQTWWMLQDRTDIRAAQQELEARFEELRETNRKLEETQNQLLQQDKMASIGQLAAGVAHEINNPVGFVSSNLNTLRGHVDELFELSAAYESVLDAPADTARREALDQTLERVEIDYLREDLPQLLDECSDGLARVKKIVQDLKDFSRVDQADWQDADLNAGLESTLNVVRHEVKYKAEVVRHLQPLPRVQCLAGQLNQVFMNLIVNAVHAIAERGTLTLSSGTEGAWVWVEVADTGCGMSEDVQRRIFEPFFTTKEVGKGTGLGLSLSFSIVQKHGGALQVWSRPGEGSRFRVWVPIGGPESLAPGSQPPTGWENTA